MYKIIGADGREYGPISADMMRQWFAEGRVNAQTRVLAEGTAEWQPLSAFPELMPPSGMAGTPPALSTLPAAGQRSAQDQMNGPAVGLIVTGILNTLLGVVRAIMAVAGVGMGAARSMGGGTEAEKMILAMSGTVGLVAGVIGVIGGIFILMGGLKARKLQSYGFCMAASIVAMIPCLSACCLVGLPIGIWAAVVLAKPEVKSAFH